MGWLLLLALVVLAPGLGLRDPAPPDEPRFVLAARAMWDSGEWLLPRRGNELYAHKPPVFMWLQASAFALVRDWRIAFLLPSLLAALATLWLLQDLGRRLWTARVGLYAALALLVTLQFGLQARRGQIDMVLVAFTTLSLWALLRHLLLQRSAALALLAGAAAGLGTVTKGVGFLPLLALLPWWLLVRRRGVDPPLQGGMIVLGFVGGCLLWLGPLLWVAVGSDDPALRAYLGEILLRQTAERYADPWHHVRPAWYYLQVIATLWLPGVLLLPWLLPAWVRRWRRRDPRYVVLLGWVVLVLVFFSASAGKREVYLLPALPAICLAAAPLLRALLARRGPRRALRVYLLLVPALLLLAALLLLTDAGGTATRLLEERGVRWADLRQVAWVLAACAALAAGATALAWRWPGVAVLALTVVLWSGYGLGIAPALDYSSSGRAVMDATRARLPAGAELGLVAWTEQLLLHAPAGTADFGFEQAWPTQWQRADAWRHGAPAQRWLLTQEPALDACIDPQQTVAVGAANRRRWVLVPPRAWRPHCAPGAAATPQQTLHGRRTAA